MCISLMLVPMVTPPLTCGYENICSCTADEAGACPHRGRRNRRRSGGSLVDVSPFFALQPEGRGLGGPATQRTGRRAVPATAPRRAAGPERPPRRETPTSAPRPPAEMEPAERSGAGEPHLMGARQGEGGAGGRGARRGATMRGEERRNEPCASAERRRPAARRAGPAQALGGGPSPSQPEGVSLIHQAALR